MRLLLDWGAAVNKVWGNYSDGDKFQSPHSSKTLSPSSNWASNISSSTVSPSSPSCDDFENTLSDLPNVKEEKIDYAAAADYDADKHREYTEILSAATLDDLVEIADILGVTYQVEQR